MLAVKIDKIEDQNGVELIYLDQINEWADKNDIQVELKYNFTLRVWEFTFYKPTRDKITNENMVLRWHYIVPRSYMDASFETLRNFSLDTMLKTAEEKLLQEVD